VQDVLGTPPDTPVHIIIPDHELAFEWLAPKGGEAGRDVDVPGVVWEREREEGRERLESHDGDKAVGEEGMGVKEGGVESMEVLEEGRGGVVYAVQEDGGVGGVEDEVLGGGEEEEEEEVLELPAGMETAVVVPDDESQADAAVRAAWEQGDCVDPARRKFSKVLSIVTLYGKCPVTLYRKCPRALKEAGSRAPEVLRSVLKSPLFSN
jgi:hypothetical protein